MDERFLSEVAERIGAQRGLAIAVQVASGERWTLAGFSEPAVKLRRPLGGVKVRPTGQVSRNHPTWGRRRGRSDAGDVEAV